MILALLKSKLFIYGVIIVCFITLLTGLWYRGTYYKGKLEDLKIQHQAEKVQMYENFAKETSLHNIRLVSIEKVNADTNKKIKELRLQNEKCQSDDYYSTANSIIDRLH